MTSDLDPIISVLYSSMYEEGRAYTSAVEPIRCLRRHRLKSCLAQECGLALAALYICHMVLTYVLAPLTYNTFESYLIY